MTPLLEAALDYAARGWRVFPLHTTARAVDPDSSWACSCGRDCGRDAGKHPRTKRGVKDATTDPEVIRQWWTKWPLANVGIATGSGLVVVDLDGAQQAEQLREIAFEAGCAVPRTLTARTGRGFHLYYWGDLPGSKTVDGLLVRGEGGYVVAPPSRHASGSRYEWVGGGELADVPAWLLEWLATGAGTRAETGLDHLGARPAWLDAPQGREDGGGRIADRLGVALAEPWTQHHEARVRAALGAIPASIQREPWLRVGMALHSLHWERPDGTDSGFELWRDWSTGCPEKFSDHDVETRWRSFGKREGVGIGSLFGLAYDHGWDGRIAGAANHAPLQNITEDHGESLFVTEANGHHALPEALTSLDPKSLIDLNQRYAVIGDLGGKCLVLGWVPSKVDETIRVPSFQSFKSFGERYANQYIEIDREGKDGDTITEAKQIGAYWLKWARRRSYEGIDLQPNAPAVLAGNVMNLWSGFAVEPQAGSWELMKRHIREILAGGDMDAARYIVRFAAWAVQYPAERAEVALVFRGGKGSGKGTFANALRCIFGQHGLQIYNSKHLVGSFNGHLRNCLLLFADEAFWAGDRQGESVLKGMLTESVLMIEQKGVDAMQWRNRLHVIMAANAEWVVPASHDERRFAMFDVDNARVGDRKYFDALHDELVGGGLAAMLHDLLKVDLTGWHPRQILHNEALRLQKERSMAPLQEWWLEILENGRLPHCLKDQPHRAGASALLWCARDRVPRLKDLNATMLGRYLGRVGGEKHHTRDGNVWAFGTVAECRKLWEKDFGKWPWANSAVEEWG